MTVPSIPMTPQEVARVYQKPLMHIYRMAHRHQWKRVRFEGRVYYNSAEVDAALNEDPGTC